MVEKNNNDLEHRIEHLEEKYKETHNFFKHTLSAITIIFIFIGIVVTIISIVSKSEISNAIRDMERKFEILSGDALKKPILNIKYQGVNLDNQILQVKLDDKNEIELDELLIENTGTKLTETMSLRFYLTENLSNPFGYWEQLKSSDDKYKSLFWFGSQINISPNETWNTSPFKATLLDTSINEIDASINVFYGGDKPTKANFKIVVIN